MIEILAIVILWGKMGDMMRERGFEKPLAFQLLVPACWVGGAVLGVFSYALLLIFSGGEPAGGGLTAYGAVLAGGLLATWGLFVLAKRCSRAQMPPPIPGVSPAPGVRPGPRKYGYERK